MAELILKRSNRKDKKFKITNPESPDKWIHFGAKGLEDFTIHKDPERRRKWLKRMSRIKNKQGKLIIYQPTSPLFWSWQLLWNKPSIEASATDIKKNFGWNIRFEQN